MKKIAILGSTGSIGINALNVVRANRQRFAVVALAAGRNIDLLKKQIEEFAPELVAVENEIFAEKLQVLLSGTSGPRICYGTEGYRKVAATEGAELILSAMSGAAGLLPTLEAIEQGKTLALANKEVMVMAGDLICRRARARGSVILPVDSEHSAIFQCLAGHSYQDVRRIILTASGGPFWHLPARDLLHVTPSQALHHPRWHMGRKITIDSATLMNKGLEVIEARWLFDIDLAKIHIHIHPQSIVHSLVEYVDGSLIAQLGMPDMKIPIAYALSFPERIPYEGVRVLNLLTAGALEFYPPDFVKFPSIKLAYAAGEQGGTAPAVLSAANEVAVQAFIDERIGFTDIPRIVEKTLSCHSRKEALAVEDILEADKWARERATEFCCKMR